MAPPAKRRRTATLADSDDEDDSQRPQANTLANFLLSSPASKASTSRAPTASPSPVKARKTNKLQPSRSNGARPASASASPEKKGRGGKRPKVEEKGKTSDILTLFSRQAQNASSKSSQAAKAIVLDDIVSDPISEDDDVLADQRASSSSLIGQMARKRARDGTQTNNLTTTSSSSKFLRPARPTAPPDDDLRPWSERFAPVNLEELAVHKRKVQDVRTWLEEVTNGRMRQRLLLLKGAAGSGKTTTIRLLAQDMGCELLEWRNPAGSMGGNMGYSSASAQFQEFLGRGGKFGQLDTDSVEPEPPKSSSSSASRQQNQSSKRIILIEEFPNTFMRSSSALTSFRNAVLGYLAANTPSLAKFSRQPTGQQITPVVMIISETLLTTTSASADSFTAHRLLGPEILRHPGTAVTEFNAVAPSFLAKALELIVLKEARKSGRRRTPGPLVLKRLGEIGDIRSAISALEFLCLKGDSEGDWGARVTFAKQKKKIKDGIAMTQAESESLEMISQREASLGIFHAVGKVMYNKREGLPPPNDTVEALPSYLQSKSRPKRSEVSVDTLIDETGTDTHTFVSALHENYALSCDSWNPLSWADSPMEHLNGCIDYLSESDLLCPSWDIFFGGQRSGVGHIGKDSGSHVLRQEEMTFQVAVRGLLFSLPSPVKRKPPPGGRPQDANSMFYPTSIKLWRSKEEFEGLVDVWSTRLLKGEESAPRKDLTQGAAAFRRPKATSSDNWITTQQSRTTSSSSAGTQRVGDEAEAAPLLSLGSAARREMLLERLPYMAQIVRGKKGAFHSLKLKDIEKVVSFQGIGGQQAGDESGDEAVEDDAGPTSGEAWATDKPTEDGAPQKKKAARIRTKSDGEVSGLPVSGLVLSDDDIEDD